ncbi:MAG: MBL fold metallo-hydrolase, partial [Spirochaetales bacterium]|nr:MBL fold metallo-hydrolase [Spirochaetales bacterium]
MIHKIITGDLGVNTYLYNYKNKKVVIVDPGDFSQEIRDMVEIKALEPTAIVLTHGHFDHIGAVNDLREYYNIPIFIH